MLFWRGFYLGPNAVLEQQAVAADAGPTYSGLHRDGVKPQLLTSAEGRTDADSACFLARIVGLPSWTIVYLDLDNGAVYTAAYLEAWISTVKSFQFTPGFNGTHASVAQLGALGVDLTDWVFRATSLETGERVLDDAAEQWVH